MTKNNLMLTKPLVLLATAMVALLTIVADYFAGPAINFPIVFVLSIWMVTWWCGLRWGITWALPLPSFRLVFVFIWREQHVAMSMFVNAAIRMEALCALAVLVNRAATYAHAHERSPFTRGPAAHLQLLQEDPMSRWKVAAIGEIHN